MIDWDVVVGTPVNGVFGIPCTYIPCNASPFQISGNFTEGFASQDPLAGEGTNLTTVQPMLGVQLSAFPSGVEPMQGDSVQLTNTQTRRLETFEVKEARADGQGTVTLVLNYAGY